MTLLHRATPVVGAIGVTDGGLPDGQAGGWWWVLVAVAALVAGAGLLAAWRRVERLLTWRERAAGVCDSLRSHVERTEGPDPSDAADLEHLRQLLADLAADAPGRPAAAATEALAAALTTLAAPPDGDRDAAIGEVVAALDEFERVAVARTVPS